MQKNGKYVVCEIFLSLVYISKCHRQQNFDSTLGLGRGQSDYGVRRGGGVSHQLFWMHDPRENEENFN